MSSLTQFIPLDPLLLFLVALVSVSFLYWIIHGKKSPPGPWGFPIVGHLPLLGTAPHKKMTEWAATYGDIYGIRMGTRPTLVINTLPLMKQAFLVQKGEFDARPDFASFKDISEGSSLAFGYNPKSWGLQKRVMMKAMNLYSRDPNHSTQNFINDEADTIVKELLESPQPVDPHRFIHLAAASVIYQMCYGSDSNPRGSEEFQHFLRNTDEFIKIQSTGGYPGDLIPQLAFLFKGRLKKFRELLAFGNKLLNKVSDEVSQSYNKEQGVRNICDALDEIASEVSEEELSRSNFPRHLFRGMARDLVGAGQATIVTVLRWFLLYCALHPQVQDKVREEIWSVVGKEREIEIPDRLKLPYTEATLLESMRMGVLFPFLLPHAAVQDTTFQEFHVKKGTLLFMNMHAISRDTSLWKDPEEFRPERFLVKKSNDILAINRDLMDQFPVFGLGKRRCAGEYLGRQESFIMCTKLIQKLQFSLVEGETYSTEGVFGLALDPAPFSVNVTSVV